MKQLVVLVFFVVLICLGCSSDKTGKANAEDYKQQTILCDDGRRVIDISQCDVDYSNPMPSIENGSRVEQEIMEIGKTGQEVSSEADARDAFEKYVDKNSLNYDFVSAEPYKKEGHEYYKIKYKYYNLGGGVGILFVDGDGKIYEGLGVI